MYLRQDTLVDDDRRTAAMPKCRNCDYDVHPSSGQCPHCGASTDSPNTSLEQQVRSLLDQGQKIAAVKLYKDQTGVGLAVAKDAVEAMQRSAVPRSGIGGDLEAELLRLLGRGETLAAVKLYKEQKGVGLADAKQAVESLATKHGLGMQRAGCLGALVTLLAAAFGLVRMIP